MRAHVFAALAIVAARAHADPKPKPVDIKAFRDQLIVLQDGGGGTYALVPGPEGPLFYAAPGHPFHQQYVTGGSRDDDKWMVSVYSPRTKMPYIGTIARRDDGSYERWCVADQSDKQTLTQLTADRAKQVIAKGSFVTSAMIHVPRAFARDDAGVYYYVDELAREYGGKGYRVFVGKKGAMKETPLVDLATDAGGELYMTKLGTLKIAYSAENSNDIRAWWIRDDKKLELTALDRYRNNPVIYRELGIYGFTGTLCDDM